MNVSAAGVEDVFDAAYYADSYADLKAAFGYDENALLTHYLTFGLNEGRCASTVFDAAAYRNAYADLDAAFGDNWDAYVDHYYAVGMAEGRTAGVLGTEDNTAGQQAPAQNPGSDSSTASPAVTGVYLMDDVPVNVTITYSDVERWENESESYAQPPAGYEWQRFTTTVTTDGSPVSASILAGYIDMDYDYNDPNIDIIYNDWVDNQRSYFFRLNNYNGKIYESCEAYIYYYPYTGKTTELSAEFEAMVPKGYLLPTAVCLDYDNDTIIRH